MAGSSPCRMAPGRLPGCAQAPARDGGAGAGRGASLALPGSSGCPSPTTHGTAVRWAPGTSQLETAPLHPGYCPAGSTGCALLGPESSVCLESWTEGVCAVLAVWLSGCLPLAPTAESESSGTASASLPRVLSNSPSVKNKVMFFWDKLSEMIIFQ